MRGIGGSVKEDMKGWVRESEEILRQAREANARLQVCQTDIRALATIVRDLVYIIRTDETEHDEILSDHQERLTNIIGEDDIG
jgi:hypothetical protein